MVPVIIRRVLAGFSTKEIAYEANISAAAVSKIISNTPHIRKQYVTHAEFRQLLNQCKATP